MYPFGKNLKSTLKSDSSNPLPEFSPLTKNCNLIFVRLLMKKKNKKVLVLVAIDSFSKFPSTLFTKTSGAKKIVKLLKSCFRIDGLPEPIRTHHGSGFKNEIVSQFCKEREMKHIFTPVADHRGNGPAERTIQTIKRKLKTKNLDPN